MKRFKETTRLVVTALAFCLLFTISMMAEAATYRPGTVYVDPEVNSKQEYYSVLQKRMYTYDEAYVDVIYPKGASLSVKSNKKALQATVISQTFENSYNEDARVYVNVTPDPSTVQTTYYYLTKNGSKWELTQEGDRFYRMLDNNKVYLVPNRTEKYVYKGYAVKVAELSQLVWSYQYDEKRSDGYYKVYNLYDAGDGKGYYYENPLGKTLVNNQVTYTPDGQLDYEYSKARIQLTSTKAGTYTVSISANGQTRKLKVCVTAYSGDRVVSATLGKTTLEKYARKASDKASTTTYVTDYRVSSSLKSGKLKIKADKGIQITGLIVATVNKDGKAVYKKVKNGGKISLSQNLASKSTSVNGYYSRSSRKHTYVYISYKDKNLGTYTTYAVTNKHGVKQIKRTIKYASDSKKYVDYLSYGNGYSMDIWSY